MEEFQGTEKLNTSNLEAILSQEEAGIEIHACLHQPFWKSSSAKSFEYLAYFLPLP